MYEFYSVFKPLNRTITYKRSMSLHIAQKKWKIILIN